MSMHFCHRKHGWLARLGHGIIQENFFHDNVKGKVMGCEKDGLVV